MKPNPVFIIILVFIAISFYYFYMIPKFPESVKNHQPKEAYELMELRADDPGFIILDVRSIEEYEKEHIKGAIIIDKKKSSFRDEVDKMDRQREYIVYCRTGRRSNEAVWIMHEFGFKNIHHLDGGITNWKNEGLPTIS